MADDPGNGELEEKAGIEEKLSQGHIPFSFPFLKNKTNKKLGNVYNS